MSVFARLGFAQVGHRPLRWAMLALGVALTVAIPVIAAGSSHLVVAQTVRRAIEALPPDERTVTVTGQYWIYQRGQTQPQVDGLIESSLRELSGERIRRQLEFRQLSQKGSTFFLAATDDLKSAATLVDGRWPSTCTPTRCEVVQIGAHKNAPLAAAVEGLGVVVVGVATRTDPTLVSGTFGTGSTPLLVGDGVDAMAKLDSLSLFQRTYGWVTPIDAKRVLSLGVDEYLRRANDIADNLSIKLTGVGLERPDATLAAEGNRAQLSARRFDLLAGATAALLIGFAVIAAVSLRREHSVLMRVLRTRGASISSIVAMTVVMLVVIAAVGGVVGVGLGLVSVVGLAASMDLRWSSALTESLSGATVAVPILVIAVVLVASAVLLWPETRESAAWYAVDAVAAVAVGVAILATSRGEATTADLSTRSDPLLVALPVLTALAAGLVAARLWPFLTASSARLLPSHRLAPQIALLSAIRRPLRAASTAGFLAAAVCAVVFAGAYRATLLSGASDQAAATVPLDATLRTGPELVGPLTAVSRSTIDSIGLGVRSFSVARSSATVRSSDGGADSVPIIGLDRDAFTKIHRWGRTSGSDIAATDLANRLGGTTLLTGSTVSAPGRGLAIDAQGVAPNAKLSLWFENPDGREAATPLVFRGGQLVGAVPDIGDPLRPVALAIQEDPDYATRHQHSIGEGDTDQPMVAGTLHLGAVRVDGAPLVWDWSRWTSDLAPTRIEAGGLRLDYKLVGPPMVLALPAPTSISIAVDPATAAVAQNSTLALKLGNVTVPARVVAVLPRFPAAGATFVVMDRSVLARLVDRADPGAGGPSEIWIAAPAAQQEQLAQALASAPYDRLRVQSRASIEHDLRSDPVATGSRALLLLVASLMLLVSVVALVIFVVGERSDDASELYAWEADGARPSVLRHSMMIRALSVVVVAVPVGVAAGVVLARAGATLVAVNGSGQTPNPPLQLSIGAVWTTLVILAVIAASVVLIVVITSRTLRERLPVRPEVDLR